jgi:cell division protein FtsB
MRFRKAFWPLLLSVVLVGVLFAGVFPTRTFLAQRTSISHAEKQLSVLDQQTAELQRRAQELQSDSEIERLAREQYNLVKPGEEAYAVLPPPTAKGQETPRVAAPANKDEGNIVQRAWHAVTDLF